METCQIGLVVETSVLSDLVGGGNLTSATTSQDNQLTARFLHFSLNPLIHLIWFWDSIYIVYCLLADLLAAGLFTEQLIDPNPGTQLHFTVFSKSSTEKHSDMLTSAVGAFSARRATRPNQVNNQQASRLAGRLAGPYFTCAIFTPPPSPTAILPWGIGCVTGARLLPLAAAGLGCSMHQNQVHRPTEILDQGRGVTGPGYCSQRRRRKPAARGAQAVKQSEPGVIAASWNHT